MSSWLDLQLGWRLPKKPKKHNKLFPLKTVSLPFSRALNQQTPLLPLLP
jgi:hypothetical protein